VTPLDIRTETIFTLLRLPAARVPARDWWTLTVLAVIGWLGAVGYLGAYRPNQVARALYALAPREVLFYGALAAAVLAAALLAATRRRSQAGAALMIAAFLIGHPLFAWIYPHLPASFRIPFRENAHALGFVWSRAAYAAALLAPMYVAWWIAFGRRDGWPRLKLGFGDLRVVGRDISAKTAPMPAWRALFTGYLFFCAIAFVVMQANVGFAPIRSGTLWPLLPAVLLAAWANAVVEELIFRGLIQPAFIRASGLGAGLWVQGLLFGLMHWGMSVGVLAALPVSLLIGFGSVVWGKFAVDTGGLGWVILAHAMVDVCLMAAFFVPPV
jgi:membrane protease YdiL (CAAX protease family)